MLRLKVTDGKPNGDVTMPNRALQLTSHKITCALFLLHGAGRPARDAMLILFRDVYDFRFSASFEEASWIVISEVSQEWRITLQGERDERKPLL
jgi:hypothetical protein